MYSQLSSKTVDLLEKKGTADVVVSAITFASCSRKLACVSKIFVISWP